MEESEIKAEFLKEIKELFKKYEITIEETDNYDDEGGVCGNDVFLRGKCGISINMIYL